jgi:4-hydroxy-tetrahydrodipicolinate synthase
MTKTFTGTGVAIATPMLADYSIDYSGFSRLIEHVISGGVDYIVLLGTTGEAPTINWSETRALLDYSVEKINGQVPLVLGLGGNDTQGLIAKLKELDGVPIQAVLSASPYYSKPTQEGIFRHYTALADVSAFPLMIYNVPHRTSSNVLAETTLRLSEHTNIIGVKEASGDLLQCSLIARDKPSGFLLLSGDDLLTLPILSLGGEGVISVIANAYPKEFTTMVNSALDGNFAIASTNHAALLQRGILAGREGNPSSIKAALEALGICDRHVRLPLAPASDSLVAEFKKSNN